MKRKSITYTAKDGFKYRKKAKTIHNPRTTVSKAPSNRGPFAGQFSTTQSVCSEIISISNGAGATETFTVVLNDTLDPMAALGTERPRGVSQLATIYNFYYVYGGTVEIEFLNRSTVPAVLAYAITSSATAPSTLREVAEIGNFHLLETKDCSSSGHKRIKLPFKVNKYIDTKKEYDTLVASYNASPTTKLHLHLWLEAISGATVYGSMVIKITQNVQWSSSKLLTAV